MTHTVILQETTEKKRLTVAFFVLMLVEPKQNTILHTLIPTYIQTDTHKQQTDTHAFPFRPLGINVHMNK